MSINCEKERERHIMKKRFIQRQIALAVVGGCLFAPFSMHSALAADEAVYDSGAVDIYAAKDAEPAPAVEEKAAPEAPCVEPVAEPEQPTENAYAGGQVAKNVDLGILGDKPALDAPFSITGYTEQTIENKQVTQVADLIANDPSISNQTLSGVSSAWNIRGFKAQQQDVQLNGLYGVAPRFYGGIEGVERVDVLKGPSVLLAGIAPNGSLGGTVNYVTKRADQEPLTRLTLSFGDGTIFTQHLDIGRRTDDGKAGLRINILNRNGESSLDEHNRTSSITIGTDYKTDRWRTSFDFGSVYNKVSDQQYQLTIGAGALKTMNNMFRVPRDTKFGADGGYRSIHENYGMIHSEYDLNKDWTAYFSYGLRNTKMEYFYNNFKLSDALGNATMQYNYNNQANKADSGEVGVRGKVFTGDWKHELTLSANRIHYTRYMNNRKVGSSLKTNLWNIDFQTPENPYSWSEPKNDENTFTGMAISDIISSPNEKWQLIMGAREQNVKVDTYNTKTGAVKTHYDESVFTPAFAAVYKPRKNVSLYANYMQGLDAGDSVVSDTTAKNYGEAFAPFKTKQYEVGVKYDFGKWATTLAGFDIQSPTLISDGAGYYSPSGEIRHRGIEWNVYGEPHQGTRIMGGIMFLDAKYRNTQDGQYDGNRVAATSRWNAVFGLEQDIPSVPGLTLTTNLTYNSDAYTNESNSFRVSPWATWDMGARYKFKAGHIPMTLRGDVYNITNRNYWRALINDGVFLGKSRTFMLSLSADF